MTREEAIRRIKAWNLDSDDMEVLSVVIPELQESEDEKIRRTLVEYFGPMAQLDLVRGVPIQKIRDWLEKQKESLHVSDTYKENANSFTDEDEKIREELIALVVWAQTFSASAITKEEANAMKAYLEKRKDASKAIEAVDRIDKYIKYTRVHTANAHDMDDSNPDKKYYIGVDDTLSNIAGILNGVYSEEKQKEATPCSVDEFTLTLRNCLSTDSELTKEQADIFATVYGKELFNVAIGKVKSGLTKEDIADFKTEKQKEQQPAEYLDLDNASQDYVYNHFCQGADFTPDYIKGLMEDAFIDGANWQKEQKPAEWSEEDKDYYDAIIAKLKVTQDDAMLTDNQIDFLKSLPEKFILQPKQEWSEEDEKLLNKVETYLDDYCDFLEDESSRFIPEVRETISRLKSLRPSKDCSGCAKHLEGYISGRGDAENKLLEQFGALITPEDELHIKPRWKPSEEQLNYVNWAYSIAVAENNTKAIEVLGELHDTLLNLI